MWMVDCLAIGMTEEQFWKSNPHKVNNYIKAFRKKQEYIDEQMWTMGAYVLNAFAVSLSNSFGGKAEYLKEPFSKSNTNKELTQEEKNRQIDLLFANLQIMQSNFEASHKSNGGKDNGN